MSEWDGAEARVNQATADEFIDLAKELPNEALPYLLEDLRELLTRSEAPSGSLGRTSSFLRSIENR